jgi:hypothetical protein
MAILATQKVLTLDYWKIAQDIKQGDIVFDRLGRKVRVKLVQTLDKQPCYRVVFFDGTSVAGNKDLKFPIETPKYRNRVYTYKGINKFRRPLLPKAISELIANPLVDKTNRLKYSVPTAAPLELPHKDLPVPPFVFGFWFFCKRADGTIKIPKQYFDFIKEKLKDHGYLLTHWRDPIKKDRVYSTKPSVNSHLVPNVPYKIPNNYLLASPEQRIELLSGIMHSKPRQYNQKTDTFRFTSKHLPTAKQIQYLAETIGCKTKLDGPNPIIGYTVFIKTKLKLMEEQTPKPIKVRQNWRMLSKIEEIIPQACVHIETDGEDGTMLVEEGFIACL